MKTHASEGYQYGQLNPTSDTHTSDYPTLGLCIDARRESREQRRYVIASTPSCKKTHQMHMNRMQTAKKEILSSVQLPSTMYTTIKHKIIQAITITNIFISSTINIIMDLSIQLFQLFLIISAGLPNFYQCSYLLIIMIPTPNNGQQQQWILAVAMKAQITGEIYIKENWKTQTNLFTATRCNMEQTDVLQ